jgi:hypothetical protein
LYSGDKYKTALLYHQPPAFHWPNLFTPFLMENTLSIYVESLNEYWDMPDNLALKWSQYETDHPIDGANHNADQIHLAWFNTLTPEEQQRITRKKAEE